MSVVVDASVVVSALLDSGEEGAWAEGVLLRQPCIAPAHMPVEVANVLRRAALAGQIHEESASMAHRDLLDLAVDLMGYEPFGPRVWELRHSASAYDAWYVAIAETFDLALATFNERLSRAPGIRCRFVTPGTRD